MFIMIEIEKIRSYKKISATELVVFGDEVRTALDYIASGGHGYIVEQEPADGLRAKISHDEPDPIRRIISILDSENITSAVRIDAVK